MVIRMFLFVIKWGFSYLIFFMVLGVVWGRRNFILFGFFILIILVMVILLICYFCMGVFFFFISGLYCVYIFKLS